jgi:hypothetical protein
MKKVTLKTKTILDVMDLDELIHASFRYYLGRRTISTCTFAKNLARIFSLLNKHTKQMLSRELLQAYEAAERLPDAKILGDQCDLKYWNLVKAKCERYNTRSEG